MEPEQIVELFVAIGAIGIGFTVTDVVPIGPLHPPTVMYTEYIPVANVVAPTMLGFCKADVNAFGPVQLYVAPATKFENKFNVEPEQIVELFVAIGAKGIGLTVTDVVPTKPLQPPTVT